MTDSSKLRGLPNAGVVMLRGKAKRAGARADARFAPKGLSFALASAYQAAGLSISQAITGLSITLAGLSGAHAQSQASNLPQGGVAVHGSATMQQNGNTLNVNTINGAGNKSAINWQSFNIGAGHTTNINQPTAQSSSLNRVITNAPSQIYGTLRSNGQVILVNQNGIAVGSGGVVDTAGFTASTLNISDADYKANRLRFEGNALSGGVQVDGVIRSSNGDIVLFAPQVSVGKAGAVKADNGNVIVGAGQNVELTGRGLEGVKFLIQGADNKAINLGTLQGNAVGVFAGTLRHSGVISAQSASMEGGKVVLRAVRDVEIVKDASLSKAPVIEASGGVNAQGLAQKGGSIQIESALGNVLIGAGSQIAANAGNVNQNPQFPDVFPSGGAITIIANQGRVITEAGSQISATGQPGGTIRLFGGQEARIASIINASSPSLGAADAAGTLVLLSAQDVGGRIEILSPQTVSLLTGAQLLASGDAGGGTILVGGDYQGANAAITNAQNTNISSGVLLEANARVNGNGGKAIVWADNDTHFSGTLQAKGGDLGGDGGFGETSGKKNLYFRGRADLSARRGRAGTLLLDPETISIQGGSGASNDPDGLVGANDGGNISTSYTITESLLESLSTNISLEAANYIQFQGTFVGNGLTLANGFTLSTRNAPIDTGISQKGIYLGGWGNSTFTISAGGNIAFLAGTGWTGTVLNAPSINANPASLLSIVSGSGNITLEAAGSMGLGSGLNLLASTGDVLIRSKLSTVALGEMASAGVNITAKNISLETQAADGLISILGSAVINATATSGNAISLRGDRLAMDSSPTLVAANASILIRPNDNARLIKLSGVTDTTGSGALQISQAEFDNLSANKAIRFGDTTSFTGNIEVGTDTLINVGSGEVALLSNGGSITQLFAITANQLRLEAGSITLNNSTNSFPLLAARSSTGPMNISTGSLNTFLNAVDGLSGLQSAGTLSFSNTNFSPSQLNLTSGGNIGAQGNINIAAFETIQVFGGGYFIDSNTSNLGASGNISLGSAVIYTNTFGRNLTLDSSSSNDAGGAISFGNVTPDTIGNALNNLTINSSGTTSGQINLPASITVGSGGASLTGRVFLSNAVTVNATGTGAITFNGEIQGNNNLNLNSDSGAITLNAIAGNGTSVGTIDIFSTDGTVNLNNNITTSAGTNVNVTAANVNVANNAQIYAGGLVYLDASGTAALNTISAGTGSVLFAGNGMVTLSAEDNITLNGQVSGKGNFDINSSAGRVIMGSNATVTGFDTSGSAGSKSISIHGQTGVTLGALAGATTLTTSYYNATVTTGSGQTIATANTGLTNFAGFHRTTLGSAGARSNIGLATNRIELSNTGLTTVFAGTNLHLLSRVGGETLNLVNASVDTSVSSTANMEVISNGILNVGSVSVLGTGTAHLDLRAANVLNFTGTITGTSTSDLVLASDESFNLGSGSGAISNFAYLGLQGFSAGQKFHFVDNSSVPVTGATLLEYAFTGNIGSSVGHVVIGRPNLIDGDISFQGTGNLAPGAGAAKKYSFFSGGNISSTAVRSLDLVEAGFSASGDIALNNVSIANSVAANGVILAASAGGTMDLKVADVDGVTLTTVGSSLPMAAQLTGLTSTGTGDISLTNLNGGVTSGTANFDIYAGAGKVTVKANQDIGTVANPLAIHASGFTLGNEGGGVNQNLIAVALTRNSSGTVQTSDTSFDTGNHLNDNIYIKAGVGTTTLEINDGFGTGNAINRTLSNASGDIRVTQANALFSGTGGTMTLNASSTTFEKLTSIASGNTVSATGGNSTITSSLGGLSGDGTFNNTGKTLIVDGTLAPGSGGIGTLTVSGNVSMGNTGVFAAELGTTATNGDRLVIGGNFDATNGTLRITETNQTTTAVGTPYTIASISGLTTNLFSVLDQPTLKFSRALNNSQSPSVFTITPTSLINNWTNSAGGSWHAAGNWSRVSVPTASTDAVIDMASFNPVVTIGSGAVANSLKLGDSLTLTASLGITGGMTVFNGGTFNHTSASGTLAAGGNVTIDAGGVLNWAGGQIGLFNDTSQLFNTAGILNISGSSASSQNLFRNWNNTGVINWTGNRSTTLLNNNNGVVVFTNNASGQINLNSTLASGSDPFIASSGAGSFSNQGTITSNSANATLATVINRPFQNLGTVISSQGTLSMTDGAGSFPADTGSYSVDTGAVLSFGGSRFLNSGATINGAGQLRLLSGSVLTVGAGVGLGVLTAGSVNLQGQLNLNTGSAKTINTLAIASGGDIFSGDAVSITSLTATGGKLSGTGLFSTTGPSAISGSFTRDGGNWSNSGIASFSGAGHIRLNNNSILTNASSGQMNYTGSGSSNAVVTATGTNRFVNQGAMSLGSGTSQRLVDVGFDNSGVVNVNNGQLILDTTSSGSESGSYNVAAGTSLLISGTRNFTSLAPGAGLFGTGLLDLQSGAQVTLSSGVSTDLLQNGSLKLANGRLTLNTGSGFTFANTVQLLGSSTLSFANAMAGALSVNGNSLLTTAASNVWTLPTLTTSTLSMGFGSSFTTNSNTILQNQGVLNFGGAGTLSLGGNFSNQGTVNLTGDGVISGVGTFINTSLGSTNRSSSAGKFTINTNFNQGGTLNAGSGTLSFANALINNGLITGGATLEVGGTGLSNAASSTLAPGGIGSIATLTIAGHANLTSGNLLFDIQTPALSDRLAVTGNIVFGTAPLKLNELSSVFVGNSMSLVTFGGTATGSLPTLDTSAIPDVTFTRSTTAPSNGALVANVTAVTTRWKDSPTNQQWTTATNWTRGHVPTAQEDVVINPTGTQTITLAGAAGSALSIALAGDDKLRISGQTLSLGATSSTIATGASLELASGALMGATSSLNLNGNLTSTGVSLIELTTFNNFGQVNVPSGTLNMNAFGLDQGTYNISGGATLAIVGRDRLMDGDTTLDGAGTLRLNGTGTLLTLNDDVVGNFLTSGTVDVNSGNLLFSGFDSDVKNLKLASNGTITTATSLDMIDVTSSFSANGGRIAGPGTLVTSGDSSVTGLLAISSGAWSNSGTLTFTAGIPAHAIQIDGTGTFTNESGGVVTSSNLLHYAVFDGRGNGGGKVVNNGLIDLTDNSGQNRHLFVSQFENTSAGEIKLNGSGKFVNYESNFANAGTLTLLGGATFASNANGNITNTGLIRGNGTLSVGTGTVFQLGDLRPGDMSSTAAVGTLTVMGNLDLGDDSDNRFDLTLGGSDRIIVNGALSFSGASGPTMVLEEINGASFLGGEIVTLMTSTGAFTSGNNGTTGGSDVTFMGNADTTNKRYSAEVIGINNAWLNSTPLGGDWYSNSNWSRGLAPNPYHDVTIDAPSGNWVTISSGAAHARSIQFPGANNTLSVSGGSTSLTVNNPLDQNTGLIVISSSNTLNLAGGATLALGGGDMYVTQGAVFNMNAATLTASASGLGEATVYNDGLINNIAGTSVLGRSGNKLVHLENSNTGTIHVQSGTLTVAATHLHQHGLINIASAASSLSFLQDDLLNEGTISLSGGSLNVGSNQLINDSAGTILGTGQISTVELLNEGTVAPGAPSNVGTLTITGDFTNDSSGILQIRADSASSSDQLIVTGSNISLNGTLSFGALGTHSFAGGNAYQPISSTVAPTGGFTLTQGLGLLITSASNQLSGHYVTLSNPAGSIVWTGLGGNSEWDNPNNWNLSRVPQVGDIVIINPSGAQTILVDSATGLSNLSLSSTLGDDTLRIINGGSLSIPGGSTLNGSLWVAGGTLTNAGSNTGASAANNILMSSGQLNINAAMDVTNLTLQGGALNISPGNTLTLTSNGNWNDPATISGGGNFHNASNSVLTIFGAGERRISGTNLINDGQIRLGMANGIDHFVLDAGSVLTNNGTLSTTSGIGIAQSQVITGNGTLDNQGGTLRAEDNTILHINTGSLLVNGGNLFAAGEGTIQLDATTASYKGNVTLASGAAIITEGMHSFDNLTLSGAGGYLRIDGSGSPTVLYNDVTLGNGANLQILGGTNTISSGKTLNVAYGYAQISTDITGTGHIHVDGSLVIEGANVSPSVHNNGNLFIYDTVTLSSLTQSSGGGDLRLFSDATLIHGAGSLLNPLGAAISGDGTINVGSGSLINQGLIQMGDNRPVGSLKVIGNADLSAGVIEFDLVGPNSYDKFSATGNITLPSSLLLIENAAFIGSGDSFTLIQSSSGTVSGSGPTLSLVNSSNIPVADVSLSKVLSASSLTAIATNVTNKWANTGSGDWAVATNWSRGHAPRAAEDAYIDASDVNAFVSITTAGATARSLSFGTLSDDSLGINAGTLSIGAGGMSMNTGSALYMSSGRLSSLGTMNFAGSMLLGGGQIDIGSMLNSAGLVSLSGTLQGAGSGNWNSGGTLSGAGTLGIGSGTFFNTGTITPGGSGIATITIAGNADITSGKLEIGLQNISSYDKLTVIGNLTAGGTISMTETSGPFLAGAEVFAPLSFSGNLSGTLPTVVSNVAGKSFAINASGINNSFFTLTASTLAPIGSIFWDGGGGDGLWSNALNWSTDLLPAVGQRVTINPAGSGSVTIASGTNINGLIGLNLDATDALFITGGSLALPGTNLALNGAVNLQGGTLSGSSAGGTFNNAFNWSGGTFAGAGAYTASSLSLAGGGSRVMAMTGGGSLNASTFTSTLGGGKLSLQSGNFIAGTNMVVSPGANLAYDGGQLTSSFLNNQGITEINTGSVVLPVTATQTGVFNIANTANLEFSRDTTLAAGASIAGGSWAIANGKTVTSTGSLNRGSGSVTFVNGTLAVASGFETDQLIMLTGGSLTSSSGGVFKVNTVFNDVAASNPITGFGSATITQQSGNLAFHQDLSVTGALSLTSATGQLLSNGGTLQGNNLFAVATSHIELVVANTATVGASSTGGNITLDMSGPTVLNALSTSAGRVASITSDSNIGHAASINTLGRIELDVGANNVSWVNFGNSIAQGLHVVSANQIQLISAAATPLTFSGAANNVQLGGGAIQLGSSTSTLNVSGPLTVVASGNITQGASLNITGITNLSSSTGDILLPIASSYSGNVLLDASGTGGTATINSNRLLGINFGASAVNTLNLTALGPVTQSAPIEVAGLATINAAGQAVNLLQTTNDINSLQINAGSLQLADTNGLSLGGSVSSNSAISFNGALSTRVGGFTTPILNLTALAPSSTVNMDVNVSGVSNFIAAGGDYSTISYRNANTGIAALSSIAATGAVGLSHGGALPLPSIQAASLSVTAIGPVTQSGTALQIAGNVNVSAAGQNITLTKAGNSIGNFSATGNNVSLVSNQTVNPDIDASGSVSITAPSINQSLGNAIDSVAFSANVTGNLNLLGSANHLGSLNASAGADMSVNNLGNLSLGTISAGGANGLSIQTTGTLSQASGLISSASTKLVAASIGSASQAVQLASAKLSLQATSGDIYANNAQTSELTSMSATGLARYSSAAGADISVVGPVQGTNLEILSGRHVVIGNSLLPVAVNASNSILFTGQDITILGGTASGAHAQVRAKGGINVNSAGNFVIQGGSGTNAYSEVVVLGNLQATASVKASIIGGSGSGAYALLDPAQGSTLLLNAPAVVVQGGSGLGAYAAILSDGDIGISGAGLSLLAGTGSDADAVVISRFGQISLPGNCNGCVNLAQMPIGDGAAVSGIFGPGRLPPTTEPTSNQVTQSIILSTQLSQAEATLESLNTEPEKDKKPTPEIVVEGQTCP